MVFIAACNALIGLDPTATGGQGGAAASIASSSAKSNASSASSSSAGGGGGGSGGSAVCSNIAVRCRDDSDCPTDKTHCCGYYPLPQQVDPTVIDCYDICPMDIGGMTHPACTASQSCPPPQNCEDAFYGNPTAYQTCF
jgi:hypothetical protein